MIDDRYPNRLYLDGGQIGRLPKIFCFEYNEEIDEAYFENDQLHIIIGVYDENGEVRQRVNTIDYMPNLDNRLKEDAMKINYILFAIKGDLYVK